VPKEARSVAEAIDIGFLIPIDTLRVTEVEL